MRVLVVDDCMDNRESMAMVLRAWGYEVRTAFDGKFALQVFGEFRPNVVLLDLAMPIMAGREVARCLREQQGARPLLLVVVSGLGREADTADIDAHLTKPADLDALKSLLDKCPAATDGVV